MGMQAKDVRGRANIAPVAVGLGVYACCAIALGVRFLPAHYGNAITFFLLAIVAGAWGVFSLFWVHYLQPRETYFGFSGATLFLRQLGCSAVASICIEFCTLFGAYLASPFVLSDWSQKRLVIYFSIVLALLTICDFIPADIVSRFFDCIVDKAMCFWRFIRMHFLKILVVLFLDVLCGAGCYFFLHLAPVASISFFVAVSVIIFSLINYYFNNRVCPEKLFLSIALPIGMVFIIAFPASNVFSWDDDVHYGRAVSLSYIAGVEMTSSDRMLTHNLYIENGFSSSASFDRVPIDMGMTWSQDGIDRLYGELNSNNNYLTASMTPGLSPDNLSLSVVGYIPSAFGLWLGRLLHLPFVAIYALGRCFNLFAYCAVCYWAIKIIPVKKVLFCVFALLPTGLFMAANYAYDPWINSFTLLGLAIFVNQLINSASSSWKMLALSQACFFVGFGPKPVYFPIMGVVLMLLWSGKGKSSARSTGIAIACIAALILFLSIVIPLLFPGSSDIGDARGGSEANAGMQLSFILSDPLRYIGILVRFLLTEYLPISFMENAFTNLAYLGSLNALVPAATGLVTLGLTIVAVLDSDSMSARLISWKNAAWSLVIISCTLGLVCSSLYVLFTAVGSETIAGVQGRYILPIIPVFFLFVFNYKIENKIPERAFAIVSIGCAAVLLSACVWVFLVSRILV